MRNLSKVTRLSLCVLIVLISGCTHAYSSHHGNRGARYNTVPYNNNAYRYNTYRHNGAYMGRPYRRY